jgi:hypothetical protein
MVSEYFYLQFLEGPTLGVGYAPPNVECHLPTRGGVVDPWCAIPFALRDGGFADYQANNLGIFLCSSRMHHVISEAISGVDRIQWLEASVSDGKEQRPYFVMHLPERVDVLNKKKSIWAGDFVVKPVLDLGAIGSHRVFSYPGTAQRVIVSSEVKSAIEAFGLIGMEFSRVSTFR